MSGTPKNEHDNENPTLENNVVGIRNNNTIQKKKIKKDKTTNKKHGSLFVAKVIKEKNIWWQYLWVSSSVCVVC